MCNGACVLIARAFVEKPGSGIGMRWQGEASRHLVMPYSVLRSRCDHRPRLLHVQKRAKAPDV